MIIFLSPHQTLEIISPNKKKMNPHRFKCFAFSILVLSYFPPMLAQQPYVGEDTSDCGNSHNSTSGLGYTCNGLRRSCLSYLTFRAQPPYASVATISTLMSVTTTQLSKLNSVSENSTFETNRMVLVPVTCSCASQFFQANASYVAQPDDNYFLIANNTFQGLSTCQAVADQNSIPPNDLAPGERITIPLRCACPSRNQSDAGVNYLLSYLITWNEYVSIISAHFGVDTGSTLAANGLSEDSLVYPFTTLLVPLQVPPTSFQVTRPQPPPPPYGTRIPQPVPAASGSNRNRTWVFVLVGVVGGVALVSLLGGLLFCAFFRRKKLKEPEPVVTSQSFESVEKTENLDGYEESHEFLESLSSTALSLKVYPFQELKSATEDFSPSCCIKGSVYRGNINGDMAAIKRRNGDVSNEINLLNKINHFNLIRLSGVAFNEGHWYLVYEYASNGPLSHWIHSTGEEKKVKTLDWNKRLQIALDVAAGLNYLHRYTTPPHVHKDLNSSNVLLDENFRGKITNFSMARSTEGHEGEFALTKHIVGTKGYMAPEYLENGVVSAKLDVYAFGVLLLEILAGKEACLVCEEANAEQLSGVLIPVLDEVNSQENLRNIMDPCLQGKYPQELALVLLRLTYSCLKKDPSDRANMDDVFQLLSRISASSLSGEWTISISEPRTTPR